VCVCARARARVRACVRACVCVCVCVCARMHCTALMSPHALYCFAIMLCARVVFACMN
jgi:hypothetical protein